MIVSTIPTDRLLDALAEHSSRFAAAASSANFSAPVEHCPGWTVAELVHHLTETQWIWATIVEERATEPPPRDDPRKPARLSDGEQALAAFRAAADRLLAVLADADPSDACWTWAEEQHDVAFVARHQVQEAAVHHWDAAIAAGRPWSMDPRIAADAVSEFLDFSVSSDGDPAPEGEPLGGRFRLRATDTGDRWELSPGATPLGVRVTHDRPDDGDLRPSTEADQGEIAATATDLLLWLYGRVPVATDRVDTDLLARFHALAFTD